MYNVVFTPSKLWKYASIKKNNSPFTVSLYYVVTSLPYKSKSGFKVFFLELYKAEAFSDLSILVPFADA